MGVTPNGVVNHLDRFGLFAAAIASRAPNFHGNIELATIVAVMPRNFLLVILILLPPFHA
jgi:hypothetical protein